MKFKYKLIGDTINYTNALEVILKNRGVENIHGFLNPDESYIEDEFLYDNMDLAYENLIFHIKNNSNICIIIDCDCDGFTSATIMYLYIQLLIILFSSKSKVEYIIHDDKSHGLDKTTMNKILKSNYNLIILPDASSNDYDEHKKLKDINIDVLVLDHHKCEKYSENAIVINNQLSEKITNKAMTGVGVVYKFCNYIDKKLNLNYSDNYLDLVAIGMIADKCDLTNLESRYLVLKGIDLIANNKNKNVFVTELVSFKKKDMNEQITISNIAFYIAPLINSIIRSGTYEEKELMFKAFIDFNEEKIFKEKIRGKGEVGLTLQQYVVRIAKRCRDIQKEVVSNGVKIIQEQIEKYKLNNYGIIIANSTGLIEKNYTGLIANKIADLYQKPCLILKKDLENFSGSARGFEKKDIKNFRNWCLGTGIFKYAEGHDNSFGCSVDSSNINKLYEIANNLPISDVLIYEVDGIFTEKTVNGFLIELIAKYKNLWGATVDEPLFVLENLYIDKNNISLIGKNKDTLKISYNGISIMLFKTNEEEYNKMIQNKAIKLTIVGKFDSNSFRGKTTPQIIIEDMIYEPTIEEFRF